MNHLNLYRSESCESFCPYLDYSGSLLIAEADTLEDRRERLVQQFFRRNGFNAQFAEAK